MTDAKVFISYSHDGDAHRDWIWGLAEALRDRGLEVVTDRDDHPPKEGWIRWMQDNLEAATHVLMVCTPTYRARFEGKAPPDEGRGVNHEAWLISGALYEEKHNTGKFIPVLPAGGTLDHVPAVMRGHRDVYTLPPAFWDLYRVLTDQKPNAPLVVGTRTLSVRPANAPPFTVPEPTAPGVPKRMDGRPLLSVQLARTQTGAVARTYTWDKGPTPPPQRTGVWSPQVAAQPDLHAWGALFPDQGIVEEVFRGLTGDIEPMRKPIVMRLGVSDAHRDLFQVDWWRACFRAAEQTLPLCAAPHRWTLELTTPSRSGNREVLVSQTPTVAIVTGGAAGALAEADALRSALEHWSTEYHGANRLIIVASAAALVQPYHVCLVLAPPESQAAAATSNAGTEFLWVRGAHVPPPGELLAGRRAAAIFEPCPSDDPPASSPLVPALEGLLRRGETPGAVASRLRAEPYSPALRAYGVYAHWSFPTLGGRRVDASTELDRIQQRGAFLDFVSNRGKRQFLAVVGHGADDVFGLGALLKSDLERKLAGQLAVQHLALGEPAATRAQFGGEWRGVIDAHVTDFAGGGDADGRIDYCRRLFGTGATNLQRLLVLDWGVVPLGDDAFRAAWMSAARAFSAAMARARAPFATVWFGSYEGMLPEGAGDAFEIDDDEHVGYRVLPAVSTVTDDEMKDYLSTHIGAMVATDRQALRKLLLARTLGKHALTARLLQHGHDQSFGVLLHALRTGAPIP